MSGTTITFGVRAVDLNLATGGVQALNGDAAITLANVLGGPSGHIQQNQLLAFLNGGAAGVQNLSDMGNGSRVMSLEVGNANDAVQITAHGRQSNSTVGLLDGAGAVEGDASTDNNFLDAATGTYAATGNNGALTGAGFSNDWGFGVDNGPESGTRWLNDGDALGFTVTQGGLRTASFIANVRDSNGSGAQDAGDVADIYLDFDGTILASGDYGARDNAARLDFAIALKDVAHGQRVEIDFDLGVIKVGGTVLTEAGIIAGQQGSIAAFFQAFNASGLNNITIGGGPNAASGAFSVQGLALETIAFGPGAGGAGGFGVGAPVLSLDSFSRPDGNASPVPGDNNNELHAYAYLDLDGNNTLDAAEVATVEKVFERFGGGIGVRDPSGDGDNNPFEGDGNAGPRNDLLDLYARGIADTLSPSGHQYGELFIRAVAPAGDGRFGIGIDTAAPGDVVSANPLDIDLGTGNLGDESGSAFINTGEVLGAVLKSGMTATALRIAYANATDLSPGTEADIIVRLFRGDTLLETVTHNIGNTDTNTPENGVFEVRDNFGQAFDRVEIQAAGLTAGVPTLDAGARFVLTDLDFAIDGLAPGAGGQGSSFLKAVHEPNGTRLFIDDATPPADQTFKPDSANHNNGPTVDVNGLIRISAFNANGTAAQVRFDQGESIGVDGAGNDDLFKRVDLGESLRFERLDGETSIGGSVTIINDANGYGAGNEVKLVLRNGDLIVGERFFDLVDDASPTGREAEVLSFTSPVQFDSVEVVALASHARFSVDEILFG